MESRVNAEGDDRSWLVRHGAVLGIVGSVGAAVGNILHPSVPDDAEAAARLIAESGIWVPAHLLIAVTVFLMAYGLLALTHAVGRGPALVWARLAFVAAVVGVVVGVVLMAADGITAKYASVAWLQSAEADRTIALQVASLAERTSFGLVVMFNIFFGGLTYLLYGIAVVLSRRFPSWLGAVIAVVGGASIVIGVIQAVHGSSSPTIELLTVITPTLFTVWTIVVCVLMLRAPTESGV